VRANHEYVATHSAEVRYDRLSVGILRWAWIVAAVVLIGAALMIGMRPVNGIFDSESFTCGSAFFGTGDDQGYGGTGQYDACLRERDHLRWIAGGSLVGGVALLGAVATSARARSRKSGNV
jgi:hypothetical protein